MKINLVYALLVLATLALPMSSALATSPAEIEEGRRTMLDMFLFVWLLGGGFSALAVCAARNNSSIVEEAEISSMVVPPIKQESNIVHDLIHA